MPYDVVAANRQAVQSGTALGATMFNNALRRQQFESEAAYRKLQEQQMAQQLSIQLQQHNMMVDAQADRAKAAAAFQADLMMNPQMVPAGGGHALPQSEGMSPMIGPDGQPLPRSEGMAPMISPEATMVPNPNAVPIEDLALKHFLGVEAKYNPKGPIDLLADVARVKQYRAAQARAEAAQAKTDAAGTKPLSTIGKMQFDRMVAAQNGDMAAVAEIDDAIAKLKAQARGKGTIETVTGPHGQSIDVYIPPVGANQIIGDGKPHIETIDGRDFIIDPKGKATPLSQDIMKRITAKAMHDMVKGNPDLAIDNPDAPGLLMPNPAKWDELTKRVGMQGSTKGFIEKNMLNLEKTVGELDSFERTVRPEDVGVKGVVSNELFDIWLPQLGFDTADVERMDNRTKLRSMVEGMLREVSSDNRFSNADREDIKRILPKPGVRTSYPETIQTVKTLKNVFGKRAIIDAQTAGKPSPMWAISAMSREKVLESIDMLDEHALIDAIRLKKITAAEAEAAFKNRPQG